MILEAQASGLPVIAVDAGGPRALIEDGRTGMLRGAGAQPLADAVCELAGSTVLRAELAAAALDTVRLRTWDAALRQLADGYRGALGRTGPFSAYAGRRTAA